MRFNLISNINNKHGLQREYEILKGELERRGHTVQGVQFNAERQWKVFADVNIFIETIVPKMFEWAPQQWVIPMPEWWLPEYQVSLRFMDHVLCKTQDCLKLFTPLVPAGHATYVGGTSFDWCRPNVRKVDEFLHVAGKSSVKNTLAILEAWRELPYKLTLVTSLGQFTQPAPQNPNITVCSNISDERLCVLYNSHRFHLCPSEYEGYGHCLHEGMGCGAIIITTDAPPMNEFGTPSELLCKPCAQYKTRMATMNRVHSFEIVKAVHAAMHMTLEYTELLTKKARRRYEDDRQEYWTNLSAFIDRACQP